MCGFINITGGFFVSMQVQSSIGKQAEFVYLNALVAQKKHKPSFEVLALLQDAVEVHISSVKVSACRLSLVLVCNTRLVCVFHQCPPSVLVYFDVGGSGANHFDVATAKLHTV